MTEAGEIAAVAVVLVPLIVIWILAVFNIIVRRSDLSIAWKGIWSAVVILIPYVGVLIYVTVRPPAQTASGGGYDATATGQAIDEIHRLVSEHEAGAITDGEFASRKALIFGVEEPTA